MFFKRKKKTIEDMVKEWIINPYSIYHNDLKETSSAIKEFNGKISCISDKIYEITYYDIIKFAHKKFHLFIFQDSTIKSFMDMNIEKDAAVIVMPQCPDKNQLEVLCQLYVYKPYPFTETINLFSLEEIKHSFDFFRIYDIDSNKEVKAFGDLDDQKDYIFISKVPFKKYSFSCNIVMRYAHNARFLQVPGLSNNNGIKPFKV